MIPGNDLAVHRILECLEENLFEPNRTWPDAVFERRSYSRWAAYEITEMIMARPYEDPDILIQEFMLKMMVLENSTSDKHKKRIFNIAIDAAEDILTLF